MKVTAFSRIGMKQHTYIAAEIFKKLMCAVTGILFLQGSLNGQSWKESSGTDWNYDLKGTKILTILYEGFNYEETIDITDYWKKWGATVDLAGSLKEHHGERNNPATGKPHDMIPASLRPGLLLQDADYSQYDLIYFPGGEGVTEFLRTSRDEIRKIIDGAVSDKKYVAAICHSPLLLAASELLRGHSVTVQGNEFKPELVKSGATISNKVFVCDGHFMTGQWPYFETFAASVAEKLQFPEGNGPFERSMKRNGTLNKFLDQRNVYFMKPGVISDDTIRLIANTSINPVMPFEMMNNSFVKLVAIKDPAIKSLVVEQLVEARLEKFKSENVTAEALKRMWTMIFNSPVVFLVFADMAAIQDGDDRETMYKIAVGLAGQTVAQMGYAAEALGYSVSVLGGSRSLIAGERIGKALNTPSDYMLVNIIGIGRPAEIANPAVRRPVSDYLVIK